MGVGVERREVARSMVFGDSVWVGKQIWSVEFAQDGMGVRVHYTAAEEDAVEVVCLTHARVRDLGPAASRRIEPHSRALPCPALAALPARPISRCSRTERPLHHPPRPTEPPRHAMRRRTLPHKPLHPPPLLLRRPLKPPIQENIARRRIDEQEPKRFEPESVVVFPVRHISDAVKPEARAAHACGSDADGMRTGLGAFRWRCRG